MANYIIQPQADHTADPDDLTNAIFAFGASDPGTVTGLTNGTTYVAREIVTSPASTAFTPAAAGPSVTYTDDFSSSSTLTNYNPPEAFLGSGTFNITGGSLISTNGDRVIAGMIKDASAQTLGLNHFVRGIVDSKNGGDMSLIVKMSDGDNFVRAYFRGNGSYFITTWIAGAETQVSTGTFSTSALDGLEIELQLYNDGDDARLILDGVTAVEGVDVSTVPDAQNVGLGAQNGWEWLSVEAGTL